MKIYLIRHGQSMLNADNDGTEMNLHQGQTDSPLSELGIKQAEKIANRLKDENFETIYSSDLSRAHKTATTIHKYHPNTELILDKRLRERSKGEFEGKSKKTHDETKLEGDIFTRKPPGGENYFDHKNRIESFLKDTIEKHENNIAIVAHGWTNRIMLHLLMKVPKEDIYINKKFSTGNTGLYIIEINDEGTNIILENCTKHLE